MLDHELQPFRTIPLVDVQAKSELHAAVRPDLGRIVVVEMPECDRFAAGAVAVLHLQFEMPVAEDASGAHPKTTIEQGFGKSLTPRTRLAQQARDLDA